MSILSILGVTTSKVKSKSDFNFIQTYTIRWEVKDGWGNKSKYNKKCFGDKSEAKEFKRLLEESAKILECWVEVSLEKN